ncbi:MAG: methenyltetrahydromethanopterin cyclohydrolase [Gemmataceae bacterium]
MTLNDRAWRIADEMEETADSLRVSVSKIVGTRLIDCGIATVGSLKAGVLLARATLSDLATVALEAGDSGPIVKVVTDDPVRACLASQYAGMQVKHEKFFAMGSGPMRAAAGREELFQHIPGKESPRCAVGILETKRIPPDDAIAHIVSKLPESVEKLTLLVAPTTSLAGTVQIVSRSVETALHKLHELKFDVRQVVSGFGTAPLPPIAKDEMTAIGRTNDAILFGGRVTLWVSCGDDEIDAIGPQMPSTASPDYGEPFADIFKRYNGDFYKIDAKLFSPAEITFVNLQSGRSRTFGKTDPALLRKSFESI